jgi:tetratricopeptide (TPR) repeat protein
VEQLTPWLLVLLFFGAFFIYLPCLDYDFVFDDHMLVADNPVIRSLPTALESMLNPISYRPVRTLSYAVDFAIGGGNPLFFHIANLLYHLMVLAALWLVLRAMGLRSPLVLVALAFFAIHPVHIDAVVYISGRRDLLAALFSLLSFWCYLEFRRTGRVWLWIPLVGLFLLAFFSKEAGIVVPILIFLYDYLEQLSRNQEASVPRALWEGWRQVWRRGRVYYGIMFGAGAFLAGYMVIGRTVTGKIGWWGGDLVTNFLTVAKIFWYYIFLLVAPVTLRADYSYDSFPISYDWADPLGLAAVVGVVLIIAALVLQALRGRFAIAFWGLWFFVTLLPMAHFIPHHELLAEHYLYLPSAGLCVLLALGLARLARWKRLMAVASGILFAAFLAVSGWIQMPAYANDLALFERVVSLAPRCVRANNFLGNRYYELGNTAAAREYYQAIVDTPVRFEREEMNTEEITELWTSLRRARREVMNREIGYYVNAYQKLARIHLAAGNKPAAVEVYQKGGVTFPILYNDLGRVLAEEGRYEDAIVWFRKARESEAAISPLLRSSIYYNLGTALLALERLDEAKEFIWKSQRDLPQGRPAHAAMANYYLALILWRQQVPDDVVVRRLKTALAYGLAPMEATNARNLLARLESAGR